MSVETTAHVRFALLTGVSKFSKVSSFSGLNNLIDITLDPRYSAICGYTDAPDPGRPMSSTPNHPLSVRRITR